MPIPAANLRSRRRRGYAILGLVIVLAIIAWLVARQMGGNPADPARPENIVTNIDKGREAACVSNRATLRQTVAMWTVSNGSVPTLEKLEEARASIPACPGGGVYSVSRDGSEIFCSLHYPAPEAATNSARMPDPTTTPLAPVAP
jgi:hypothetical protein